MNQTSKQSDLPGNRRTAIVIRTLSERVFEIVRERIVIGELTGGMAIRQDALATELGVSKIPLREALVRLEQEGLLTSQANRGYSVQHLSVEQVDEIYALRLLVEPRAGGHAALIADDQARADAIAAFETLDRAVHTDLHAVAVSNRHFHTALVRPGGKLLTTQLIERLSVMAERYVVAHLQPSGRGSRAHREHQQLLDVWLARDADGFAALLTAHIQATLDDLRQQFGAA